MLERKNMNEGVFSCLKIQFKKKGGTKICVIPDDLFRQYLEFITLLPDKMNDMGFHLLTMNMKKLSPELNCFVDNYRVPSIISLYRL